MGLLFDEAWSQAVRLPSTVAISMKQSKATLSGFIDPAIMASDEIINEVIGGTVAGGSDGKLQRSLPLGHPEYPYLFADDITRDGIGEPTYAEAEPLDFEAPVIGHYATWSNYKHTINFSTRPYAVLKDESIEMQEITWYDDEGNATTDSYPTEWWRYTDYEELPASEYIRADRGQYVFSNQVGGGKPDATVKAPGEIKTPKNTSILKFYWYQVPYSYITSDNSYLKAGLNRINQLDWYGYAAGTLLFVGMDQTRYTPPNPEYDTWFDTATFSTEKLVDITMTFVRFNPPELTADEMPDPMPTLGCDVVGGHNLLPYLAGGTGKFYYGTNPDGRPLNRSYPFQLLFCNPDA